MNVQDTLTMVSDFYLFVYMEYGQNSVMFIGPEKSIDCQPSAFLDIHLD